MNQVDNVILAKINEIKQLVKAAYEINNAPTNKKEGHKD